MPNPWLNVHKSTAAMNYFFSNMTLGYLRIRHTTAVPFSPFTYEYEYYTIMALGRGEYSPIQRAVTVLLY
jgi:hypothetical protein